MYGTPITTVPGFFTGWVSWFTGDATDLFPSAYATKATRFAKLMGGVDAVLAAAKADHETGDHQLAAELARSPCGPTPGPRTPGCSKRRPCGHAATRS